MGDQIERINRLLCSNYKSSIDCPLIDGRYADATPQSLLYHTVLNASVANEKLVASDAPIDEHSFAIACDLLERFVVTNFLGPCPNDIQYAGRAQRPDSADVASLLRVDGEDINVNTKLPELLVVSKAIFVRLLANINAPALDQPLQLGVRWWYLRLLYVHQQIIDEHTNTLFTAFQQQSDALLEATENEFRIADPEIRALLRLEIAQGYLAYRRAWRATDLIEAARSALDVELNVQGFLGKRTKWQEKALPQLALRVNYGANSFEPNAMTTPEARELPCLLSLDDEVRLERVTFVREEDNRTLVLPALVQLLVLGTLQYLIRSQPKDTLADEELTPYLTTLLYQPHGAWSTRITTLLLNITQESTHKRTVERSLKQCEEVVRLLTGVDSQASQERLSLWPSAHIRPVWHVQSQLGDLMCSLGMIKTALDLFLGLHRWAEVISCYTVLEQRHKAAEIIEQELAKRPTVELYCLLGDATDDPQHYERAWQFSQERSGRAQRHWGCWHFARKDYAAAIPHLQRSLALNSLQETTWARLGYAALQLEQWPLAAEAYRRYTAIEPNGFECWNNLCKAYVNMGDKRRAHKVLQEALKCNFGNWKVWDNYLLVSIDTGHFEDALNAYNQLIELRGKHFDAQALEIVCRAVAADVPEADSGEGTRARLLKKAQRLCGRLGVAHAGEAVVWEMAAVLHDAEPLQQAQALQKAFRCLTQTRTETVWSKRTDAVAKVLDVSDRLTDAALAAWSARTESTRAACASQLSSARMSVQGAVRAAKDESWEEHADAVVALEGKLEEIKQQLLSK